MGRDPNPCPGSAGPRAATLGDASDQKRRRQDKKPEQPKPDPNTKHGKTSSQSRELISRFCGGGGAVLVGSHIGWEASIRHPMLGLWLIVLDSTPDLSPACPPTSKSGPGAQLATLTWPLKESPACTLTHSATFNAALGLTSSIPLDIGH